jgi:hypothetical protein
MAFKLSESIPQVASTNWQALREIAQEVESGNPDLGIYGLSTLKGDSQFMDWKLIVTAYLLHRLGDQAEAKKTLRDCIELGETELAKETAKMLLQSWEEE